MSPTTETEPTAKVSPDSLRSQPWAAPTESIYAHAVYVADPCAIATILTPGLHCFKTPLAQLFNNHVHLITLDFNHAVFH